MTDSRIMDMVPGDTRDIVRRYQKLQDIATALSEEHDTGKLLHLILREGRALTGADSGSVYVRQDEVEPNPNATAKDLDLNKVTPGLVLKVVQNDSIEFPFKELHLPFDTRTMAGYVATSGAVLNLSDVYALPANVPYSYNRDFDKASGYRCKSMLVIPMRNRLGDIIGAIQLINKKRDPSARLKSHEEVNRQVAAFDLVDEELALALGSQAAVCVEKAMLYEEIEAMFEGLVSSFTLALEKRDRTTWGHSLRVADYAVAIAKAINEAPSEAFGGLRFTVGQLRELRYAALLHDIGKIGVPEAVLDKRNKLPDGEIEAIAYRMAYWKERLAREGRPNGHLDGWMVLVRKINLPAGMSEDDAKLLKEIAAARFTDIDGSEKPMLTAREYESLAIMRGNLTDEERRQIERHIVDTWEILKRVPWPRLAPHVPHIAASHHEKVNGRGYPWGFKGEEIPLGGRILAIVDIYEALTARDRPYKPPMPVEKALKILDEEAQKGNIDAKIYGLFKDRKIYSLFAGETGFVQRPPTTALKT